MMLLIERELCIIEDDPEALILPGDELLKSNEAPVVLKLDAKCLMSSDK